MAEMVEWGIKCVAVYSFIQVSFSVQILIYQLSKVDVGKKCLVHQLEQSIKSFIPLESMLDNISIRNWVSKIMFIRTLSD